MALEDADNLFGDPVLVPDPVEFSGIRIVPSPVIGILGVDVYRYGEAVGAHLLRSPHFPPVEGGSSPAIIMKLLRKLLKVNEYGSEAVGGTAYPVERNLLPVKPFDCHQVSFDSLLRIPIDSLEKSLAADPSGILKVVRGIISPGVWD